MKKTSFFILLLFLTFTLVYGQDDKLKKIKQIYAETNDRIAKSKLPSEKGSGNYYCNEVLVNSTNGAWRAVGIYSNKIAFWYNDQPGFQQEENQPDWIVLEKIEVNSLISVGTFHEEYLYDKGQLIFCYKTTEYGDVPKKEYRYYYWNGKLFRYQEDQELKDLNSANDKEVIDRSLELQKLFLKTFN